MNQHPVSPWNIPNALTVFRILGVPIFGYFLLVDGGESIEMRIWATLIFSVLMITDRIDGSIARKYQLITDFGKIADPIADKALTGMAFIGLSIIGGIWWWVTILILVREWGITFMRFGMMKYQVMPASQGGRVKTVTQTAAIIGYLLPVELWTGWWASGLQWVAHILLAVALFVTLITGIWYVRDAVNLRKDQQA